MFWLYFIVATAVISVSFSSGIIASLTLHGPESPQLWQTAGLICLAIISAFLLLVWLAVKNGHFNLEDLGRFLPADPTLPPLLPSGEPDWDRMQGRRKGVAPLPKEIEREAELLLNQSAT